MREKPAILGGEPITRKPIKFVEIIIGEEEKRAVLEIIERKEFVSNEFIEKLEKEFARFVGTKYALAISNGTDALFLSYLALGISFHDFVITTPLTFVATASTIIHVGAIPIFADVDKDSNLSPHATSEVIPKYKKEIKGITVVHTYGKPVEMEKFSEIAQENDLYLIEDASHAHGALYKGRKVGSIGDVGVFSLYPSKIIAAGGWGGIITTNNKELADKLILLRAHGELRHIYGQKGAYLYRRLGYNMRMSNIEAAVAYYQLKRINEFIEKRRKIARYLSELLASIEGISTPTENEYCKHVYYIYACLLYTSPSPRDRG